ncbi:wall-associated receptor kinase 2-like [Oryza glaberrima]|uniref:wall-associated receptor kinase 2-like n=1 Tax=Oryza glaberrima TaxID=4538 RepID=UPI00224C0E5B|nr:wall-associated receptor kinase 2-like [Oryza glaberrima]
MPFHMLASLLWLCCGGIAAYCSAASAAICVRSCGGVEIPYPFGLDPACALPGFKLTCNTTGDGKLYYKGVELLNISLTEGQVRMRMDIATYCYNSTSGGMNSMSWLLNLKGTPFRLSDFGNKFTAIGCRTLAYLIVDGELTTGCTATCKANDLMKLTDSVCIGIGCCQMAIPGALQSYGVTFDSSFNTTEIYNISRCSYAALVEASSFNFSRNYSVSSAFNDHYHGQAPLLVDWAIGNDTCNVARKKLNYMCISRNSECVNSLHGVGYICNCSKGFYGNPYLKPEDPDSCQDIDECKEPNKYPCYGKCINKYGGYDCNCKFGTRGNAYDGPCHIGLATGIAIGLGVGFGILLLSLCGVFLLRKHRRDLQKQLRKEYFLKNKGLLLEQLMSSDEDASDSTKIFSLDELKKATNNFDPMRILGTGGHGTVYKGILSDQRVVAIKNPKIIQEEEINQFINEVAILCQINHRNIVKLHGCCLETEVPLLVYDFVPNGSLFSIIHSNPSNDKFSLSWDDCLRIAAEAAGALYYLHSAATISVFHRDVKSSNILLDGNYTAKVSDFGASRLIPINQTHVITNVQGTFGYLDPEYYYTGELNEKSDVYSFGVVLVELLLRKEPIFTSDSGSTTSLSNYFLWGLKEMPIIEMISCQVLEEASEDEINTVASLAEECLRLRGEERPSMKQVEMTLQLLRNKRLRSFNTILESNDEIQPLLPTGPAPIHHALAIDNPTKLMHATSSSSHDLR